MKKRSIEDLERAAWFARLALGVYTANPRPPKEVPHKPFVA